MLIVLCMPHRETVSRVSLPCCQNTGMQVLAGDVQQAAESFRAFYGVWQRFGVLPERYFFAGEGALHPTEHYYPLRPELLESAFYLHQVPIGLPCALNSVMLIGLR